jgi:hypothetical protein
MRQTRRQYHDRLPLRSRKIGFEEALARVKREIKRRAVADGVIIDPTRRPPRYEWDWECLSAGDAGTVQADTRSQARSLIKSALGLRKKDRLPIDTTIIKVEGGEAS